MMKNKILLLFLFIYQCFTAQNAVNDNYTTETNVPVNATAPGLLSNDQTNASNDPITVTTFIIEATTYTSGQTASFTQGTITINADGSFNFTPLAGFNGTSVINYTISDGTTTSSANLNITVQSFNNLLSITSLTSCNQGYTLDENNVGVYKIRYSLQITNTSASVGYEESSLIRNINLTNNLNTTYGNGCASINEGDITINTSASRDSNNIKYPRDFINTNNPINPNFLDATSDQVFIANHPFILYPRQTITINFCVTINPLCNGRTGSSIDFDTEFEATSPTRGSDNENLLLTDFHTTEAIITAGLLVADNAPDSNPDGTYRDVFTVIITNQGTAIANNVNFNMGLGNFFDNGVVFDQLSVSQVAGPSVSINTAYNGDTETQLLTSSAPGNSLNVGESITLEINYLTAPYSSAAGQAFLQLDYSQTQGTDDGGETEDPNNFDESTTENRKIYSFVTWSDNLSSGRPNHLDRYYPISSAKNVDITTLQCDCNTSVIRYLFRTGSTIDKKITKTNIAPDGILEHEEVTFEITFTNTSNIVQLDNLSLIDNLNSICGNKIVSVNKPTILNSTADITPTINNNYNGTTEANIFTSAPSLLKKDQTVTVEFTVVFNENCLGVNAAMFSATDPIDRTVTPNSPGTVPIDISTDIDNDGITNDIDLDDDDDTIPDIDEYQGLNPLDDDDNDLIPNYRDTDYGPDINSDGIVDLFDFDNDGVPNHFDLDSDNDGIFDIVEAEAARDITIFDPDQNGQTNNPVGLNGLDNSVEDTDTFTAIISFTIANTDEDNPNNPNFLDIDSDGDGIVDNIEAQTSSGYLPPNGTVGTNGVDTAAAYQNGLTPTNTDDDTTPDYLDTNSDNDAYFDTIEGWDFDYDRIADTVMSNTDTDNDGLDDAYDNNNVLLNPTNGQVPLDFPNRDIPETPELDWRETRGIVIIISDASATEGGDLMFTISLVSQKDNTQLVVSGTPITIDFSTVDGTATATQYNIANAPFDYNPISNQNFTIPPSTSTIQFTVTSLDDPIYELDELLTLNGTVTSKSTINLEISAVGTITDNETPPTITMTNSRENEGVGLEHTITLSHPSSTPILIEVATSDDIAISPDDYTSVATNLIIEGTTDPASANTEVLFNIPPTVIDNLKEADEETLNVIGSVTSSNVASEDLTKTATIVDIDPYPIIAINDFTVTEGEPLLFTLTLLNANLEPMQSDAPLVFQLESLSDTATEIVDFEKIATNFSFPAFTTTITQTVATIDDQLNEITEKMLLQATLVTPLETLISFGTGTILENDFPNLFSPNGDGQSDLFRIDGFERFPNFKLTIFDRWGSIIYNYNNNGNMSPTWWDGTHNGKPVIEGVYYFTLHYNNGTTPPKTNFIQLIR